MIINQTIHIELAPEGPKIIDGYWHEWVNGEWVNTGRKAEGEDGTDGYSVSLSKSEHTFNYDKNGNLKGILSDGTISVEVLNGSNPLICDSLAVSPPTLDGSYRVTDISISPSTTLSYNVDRQNNIFRLIPTLIDAEEVMVTFTIVARTKGINTAFTRQLKYQKSHDGADGTDGTDGDSVVHIYKQYPTKPATPSSGVVNPTGWSRNPDYILSIVSQTNWAVNGKWHQSEELTATGNSATSRITFTTYKDAQTITLELWADGHATYDYVYAGKLDTAASTSNYYDRVRGGRIIITYDVPTAGNHYIDIFWRKGILTIVGSNRGYYAIISDVKVWRSATNVIGGVPQDWSEPQQFFIDSALEERIYCLSKTTTAPAISDSDAHINDYIPLPCSLSSYRGDFTTYRAYSIGEVVKYQLQYYKVIKNVLGTYTGNPSNTQYFEMIPGWTDNPTGANKDFPYEIIATRKKQADGLWGPFVTSVWSNYGIGTNYIPMGWWNSDVTYSKTDLGIPLVKKEDGTALGYSVYTLKVSASTPGSFILSEWDLVESADFIYMQQAYIERLQAQLISAVTVELKEDPSSYVTAGLSGIQGAAKDKPAFWAGGTYEQALSGTAKAIIRHDGTVKFTSAEITGTVNAISGTFNNVIFQSGHIGGFRVSGTGLTNGPDFNNDAYIIFRNDENKTFAGIGGNILPSSSGLTAVARFENGATNNFYGSTNYGVIIEASGASRNIGISLVGDIVMKGALVSIEPTFQSVGYTDSIILNISKYRRFLFTPGTSQYLSVDLPYSSQIVDAFGSYKLPSYWNIEIEIEVAWNASGSIALRGSSGGIFVNNNGDAVNHEDTYAYGIIKMKKGDVVTVRYNSYHGRWQLINHNY